MRVLVAEDDRISRRILEKSLEKWGYEAVLACDGRQAWEELEKSDAPPLVLLDRMMPHMDGITVLRRLREERPSELFYVILVTAMENKKNVVEGFAAGADDYVIKPYDVQELEARLRAGHRIVDLQQRLSRRIGELKEALDHIRTLQGIIPICMHCHKIRSEEEVWQRLEAYISEHSEATFSHGICPECLAEHYPEIDPKK